MSLKKILITAFSFISVSMAAANHTDEELLNLQVMTRFDYQRFILDGSSDRLNSGFRGNNLSIFLTGNLNDHFSYVYRQRLNRLKRDENFFDATDFLFLTYTTDSNWKFCAGKQVTAMGGYEFELAPIDCYYVSEYCYNMACYQFGATVAKVFGKDKTDELQFQVCRSPYSGVKTDKDIYCYNLMWTGEHGVFLPLWSVNFVEYQSGEFMNYISLGTKFKFNKVSFFVDIMNRSFLDSYSLFKDFTLVGKVDIDLCDHVHLFVKAGHDYNNLDKAGDWSVLPGTLISRVGGGLEIFPLKGNKDLRLHFVGSHHFGDNSNPEGTLLDKQTYLNVGISWRMNLLSFKR